MASKPTKHDIDYSKDHPDFAPPLCGADVEGQEDWRAFANDEINCRDCKRIRKIAKQKEDAAYARRMRARKERLEKTPVDPNDRYLIECREHSRPGQTHRLWWGPDSKGYVFDLDRAGRYSRESAISIVRHVSDRDEVMWPESDILAGKGGRIQKTVVWEGG